LDELKEEVIVVMLMRFDPFREIDRVFDRAFTSARQPSMPMDAYRHGDSFVVHLDLPGVDPASIDVSAEQDVLTVTAQRHWEPVEGDELIASERPHGTFNRQFFLGDALNTEGIHATYDNGVLTLTIPVAEQARPRKIEVASSSTRQAISATSQ
jgi:HSP20 family protein